MTVIFGITFVGGALVGADQKHHVIGTNQAAQNAKKTVRLSSRAVGAKAGFAGPTADKIWHRARHEIAGRDMDASDVADLVQRLAPAVLDECRIDFGSAATNIVLQFIVAGLTGAVPTIHIIEAHTAKRADASGPGQMFAFGTRANTNDIATQLLQQATYSGPEGLMGDIVKWTRNLVADERILSDYSVGYPVDISVVTPGFISDHTIPQNGISALMPVRLI